VKQNVKINKKKEIRKLLKTKLKKTIIFEKGKVYVIQIN
jgi:hypothetical protein